MNRGWFSESDLEIMAAVCKELDEINAASETVTESSDTFKLEHSEDKIHGVTPLLIRHHKVKGWSL